MSLINEALKKAQRLRTEDPAGTQPPMPGGSGARVTKRSQPRTSQQLVVLAAAVIVLVVLTVVATVWLVNRPAPAKPAPQVAAVAPPKPASTGATPPPTPIVVIPAIQPSPPPAEAPKPKLPETSVNPAPPAPSHPEPAPVVTPTPAPITPPLPAIASDTLAVPAPEAPPVAAPPAPAAPPKTDERIHVYVDAIRVTAIRSSGDDTRVLMNDRVFRLNDIVDRGLGLRLTKVNPNSLIFTDVNGATYVKYF